MQMLISNLESEKKALNLRLWEANIDKIELAAEMTRQTSQQTNPDTEEVFSGRESVMARVGIIESSTSMSKYFLTEQSRRITGVFVVDLNSKVDFLVNSEIMQKLKQAKCQALIQEAKLSNTNELLSQANMSI